MKVIELSEREKREIEDALKQKMSGRYFKRLQCIKLLSQGYKPSQISQMLEVHYNSVYAWIKTYEKEGLNGLLDKPKSGRPKRLSEEQEKKVKGWAKKWPRQLRKVLKKIREVYGIEISVDTLKRILKRQRMRYKRVRQTVKGQRNEEKFRAKKEEIEELKKEEDKGEIELFFYDESGFSTKSTVGYAWQEIRQRIAINCERSRNISVLGFLNRSNENMSCVVEGSVTSRAVVTVFEEFLLTRSGEKPVVVVIDNAPTHTSNEFKAKRIEWEVKYNVKIVYQSTYSPELNITERLWQEIKHRWLPFGAYDTFKQLKKDLVEVLSKVGSEFTISFA